MIPERAGSFELPASYFVGNFDFHDVAAGDFDGDHKPDLVVATRAAAVVLLNTGGGTFAPKVDYPTDTLLGRSVAVGDLNGDGKLDVAMTSAGRSAGPGIVSVFLGIGDGSFGTAIGIPQAITSADFNGDGTADLAVSGSTQGFGGLLGNGDGTFQTTVPTFVGGSSALTAADLNGDGKPNAVVGASGSRCC